MVGSLSEVQWTELLIQLSAVLAKFWQNFSAFAVLRIFTICCNENKETVDAFLTDSTACTCSTALATQLHLDCRGSVFENRFGYFWCEFGIYYLNNSTIFFGWQKGTVFSFETCVFLFPLPTSKQDFQLKLYPLVLIFFLDIANATVQFTWLMSHRQTTFMQKS